MERPSIRALVFDFDGLILDTETPVFESWQEIFQEHGCSLAIEDWAAALGSGEPVFDTHAHLERLAGCSLDRDALRARRRKRELDLGAGNEVLPGVVDYLDRARSLGLKLAVASSSSRAWVSGHLTRLELASYFECLHCRDDVARVKPDPDLYVAAVAALGVRPEQAIAFEDSPNGVTAAKRAGLFCVAVPNSISGRLRLDHADLCLPSLQTPPAPPLEVLIARLVAPPPALSPPR